MTTDTTRPALKTRQVIFWSCDPDIEQLSHEDAEEALEYFIDDLRVGTSFEDSLRAAAPVTLYGWARVEMSDNELDGWADCAVEHLVEMMDESVWGDPNGNSEIMGEAASKRVQAAVLAALKTERDNGHLAPWSCEVVEKRELDAATLVAEARRIAPHWFF